MKIEVNYSVLKTVELEVDNKFKGMTNDNDKWEKYVNELATLVNDKIRAIENNEDAEVLGVNDVEADDVIYEN